MTKPVPDRRLNMASGEDDGHYPLTGRCTVKVVPRPTSL